MRANAFRAVDHIRLLNQLKKDVLASGSPVSKEQLREGFKSCGLPYNLCFWAEFKKSGLLVQVEDGFVWSTKTPIHFKTLQSIYLKYQARAKIYNDRYRNKISKDSELKRQEIENAISLLKANGYEVFMPYKDMYKKL